MQQQPGNLSRNQIVIVGAGPGGICAGIKLKQAGFEDFIILEREAETGGTWVRNRYPGLTCDVHAYLYSFTFEQKPDWTEAYAPQSEIKAYMQGLVDRYGLAPYIRLQTAVTSAAWDDEQAEWHIRTAGGGEFVCQVFVSALGMFNELQWPDIPGLTDFAGHTIHTGDWPENADLADKRVAVIGSAASAVQTVPKIAPRVRQLTVYQRTANWIFPRPDESFSAADREALRADPGRVQAKRAEEHALLEQLITFEAPEMLAELEQAALDNLAVVEDPETRRKLQPQLSIGAQRPLFSNEFYASFNRSNVELVTEPIDAITATGVRSGGRERPADVLILATGYAANKFLSVIDVSGRNGLDLDHAWAEGPEAYLGMTTAGFPNLFMLYGPNSNNGTILYMLELQVDYIVRKLQYMRDQDITWIDIRRSAQARYNAELQARMRNTVWNEPGSQYYRIGNGKVVTQWPYNMAAYESRTRQPDLDAFEIQPANQPENSIAQG